MAGRRAAREGGADERLDPPRGRARDPVQPVVDDDAVPPLQRRAVPELGVFEAVGSVRIASSEESLLELRRAASAAAGIGLEAELISPAEVLERLPEADGAPILGAVWMPGDGHVDPHIATHAVAGGGRRAARRRIRAGQIGRAHV